jgi:diaminopimelate decarboxylase
VTEAVDSFRELAAAFAGVAIHYAVKANPHPRLLTALHAAGCRFEAASWAEVRAVIRAGAEPTAVLFTHPVKPAADIARARRRGSGGSPPFHVGSQTMDPSAWDRPIGQCGQIMAALDACGIRIAMLDVGGGFPVRYHTDPPPLASYAAAITAAAARLPYPVTLACEPGRAIAAPAGTMIASVIGTAWRGSTLRVSLDPGAFHGLIEALESGRQLAFPVTIPAAGNRPRVPSMLTGPSWDSQDTILDRVQLPTPRAGDQVLIGNAGAYTTCYSGRSAFNGYPAPAIKITKTAAACSPLDEKAEFTITAASDGIQDSA